ncbi:MAG TPA: hypothetical protein VFS70_05960, partial [Actinomycetota bacterium]|nr:hypothetical protein [Actinomycetota bacterium]
MLLFLAAFPLSPLILAAWALGTAVLCGGRVRRWQLALAAVTVGAVVVLVEGGPADAAAHHFAGVLTLVDQFGAAQVVMSRLGAFLLPQLPLAIPAGLLVASVGRRADLMGPEFTDAARRRVERADQRGQGKARKLAVRPRKRTRRPTTPWRSRSAATYPMTGARAATWSCPPGSLGCPGWSL